MLRDEILFPVLHLPGVVEGDEGESNEERHGGRQEQWRGNDDENNLDDVFGSGPGSPVFESDGDEPGDHPYARESHHTTYSSRRAGGRGADGNREYSDIPRLKEKHETEGYRDGVTKGKAESVQEGFDEGYSLGAMLGLRIGRILGVLEGIWKGIVEGDGPESDAEERKKERERLETLWKSAVEELSTKGVFARDFWDEDGIWKFDVPGEDGKEVTFEDVVSAHPLVRKWESRMNEAVDRWSIDLCIMDSETRIKDEVELDEEDVGILETGKGATAKKKAAEESIAPPGELMGIAKSELNW